MKTIIKNVVSRLIVVLVILIGFNVLYKKEFYDTDVQKYSRVKNRIDSAFQYGDIVYLGESSNTSYNPWTDTLKESISDFLQLYLPGKRIEAVTHESYHPGLFRQMLNLHPNNRGLFEFMARHQDQTIVLGVNIRTCGPTAVFSGNEASNQQEALFYSKRPSLLTRLFLSLKYYDHRDALEMERLKFQWWRSVDISGAGLDTFRISNKYKTVKRWIDDLASDQRPELPVQVKNMADAYVKEFAFLLDDENVRVQDLKEIVEICNELSVNLIFHILPPNIHHAEGLFGNQLKQYLDYNYSFLKKRFENWGVTVVDNYNLPEANEKVSRFTDQWYPTEHYDAAIRKAIAKSLVPVLVEEKSVIKDIFTLRNNEPNFNIKMPYSDSLIGVWRELK
jgi:hypothetical protein